MFEKVIAIQLMNNLPTAPASRHCPVLYTASPPSSAHPNLISPKREYVKLLIRLYSPAFIFS